jgi:hypothetical protein
MHTIGIHLENYYCSPGETHIVRYKVSNNEDTRKLAEELANLRGSTFQKLDLNQDEKVSWKQAGIPKDLWQIECLSKVALLYNYYRTREHLQSNKHNHEGEFLAIRPQLLEKLRTHVKRELSIKEIMKVLKCERSTASRYLLFLLYIESIKTETI